MLRSVVSVAGAFTDDSRVSHFCLAETSVRVPLMGLRIDRADRHENVGTHDRCLDRFGNDRKRARGEKRRHRQRTEPNKPNRRPPDLPALR